MVSHAVLALGLAVVAGAADMLGGILTVAGLRTARISILYATGLAAGFIVAAAILDRVPEAMTQNPYGAVYILIGFMAIYLVENLFSTHAHDFPDTTPHQHAHALVSEFQPEECHISAHASTTAMVGLLLHTLFDGVAIAAGFLTSEHTGYVMFLAVIFHKFPEGFSASALMLSAGRGRRVALWAAGLLGGSTILGAVLTLLLSFHDASWSRVCLTLATGTFLYIGCSDMIPATNKGHDRKVLGMVVLGALLFALSSAGLRYAGFVE
jgi:ZIP family zinc transporter/zinc and cadmium transporter